MCLNHANAHHVLFIAPLEDTEINRGSSSFNFSRKAAKQRQRSSSQSLKIFFFHVSAQLFQTNDLS